MKPLPAVQLEAWDAYIDFILGKDDAGTIVRLFERCLVACASYPGRVDVCPEKYKMGCSTKKLKPGMGGKQIPTLCKGS